MNKKMHEGPHNGKILVCTLIAFAMLIGALRPALAIEESIVKPSKEEVKEWAAFAVQDLLHMDYESVKDLNLDNTNKELITEGGCISFLLALINYRIIKQFRGHQTEMRAEFFDPENVTDRIKIRKEQFNRSDKTYSWKLTIPLSMKIKRRYADFSFYYEAIVTVKQKPGATNDFIIDRWYSRKIGAEGLGASAGSRKTRLPNDTADQCKSEGD